MKCYAYCITKGFDHQMVVKIDYHCVPLYYDIDIHSILTTGQLTFKKNNSNGRNARVENLGKA